MADRIAVGALVEEGPVEAVLQDRADRGDGSRLDRDATAAGGLEARLAISAG